MNLAVIELVCTTLLFRSKLRVMGRYRASVTCTCGEKFCLPESLGAKQAAALLLSTVWADGDCIWALAREGPKLDLAQI